VGRNSEVCKYVNTDTREESASNPTESSSLAGAGTAVVVDLHILHGIQIQDSPTFLLVDVIEKKKQSTAGDCWYRPDAKRRSRTLRLSLAVRLGTV
jgi:hypothetical protein